MSEIKLAVLIPTRGDRPKFLENCIQQLKRQTLQPEIIEIVNFPPANGEKDITKRYRIGYENLKNKGLDFIAFIEEDDAYAPNYLEFMVENWIKHGKPDLFGTNYTHYYHIKVHHYFTMHHEQRASMMNTFIKPDMKLTWCPDTTAYTDMHLWDNLKHLSRYLISPSPPISLGIKHGVGLCGGEFHSNKMDVYHIAERGKKDEGLALLKQVCDKDSFEFFSTYFDL